MRKRRGEEKEKKKEKWKIRDKCTRVTDIGKLYVYALKSFKPPTKNILQGILLTPQNPLNFFL